MPEEEEKMEPIGTVGKVIIGVTIAGILFLVLLVIGTFTKRRLAEESSYEDKRQYYVSVIFIILIF